MVGHELGVEQHEAAGAQAGHEMHQRDFRGVTRAMEHALAEESAAERDTVKSSHQIVVEINLDAVAMPALIQLAIERADALVDPGARPSRLRLCAAVDHPVEIAVDGNFELV